MSDPVYVSALIKHAAGKREVIEEGLKALAAEVEKNEPGCLVYEIFYNPEDGAFIIAEAYKDAAAAQAHKETPHFAEAVKHGNTDLEYPPIIKVVSKAGGFRRS